MAVHWHTNPEVVNAAIAADPRAAYDELCAEKAALAERIAAHREEHGTIPNTMEYERVTLDAKCELARFALDNAIAAGTVAAEAPAPAATEPPPATESDAPPAAES